MVVLERDKSENARAYALRVLAYNIIHLEFKHGEALNEKEIASALQVSRTPVREALIELIKSGLVNIIPQKGSYISKIDYNIIEESRFVRLALELAVLKLVCNGIDDIYILKLKSNIAEQELYGAQTSGAELITLDNSFHELLFEAVGKEWSYNILKAQMSYFDRFRILILNSLDFSKTIQDHKNLLEAVIEKNYSLAESIMIQHLGKKDSEKEKILSLYPDYFIQ